MAAVDRACVVFPPCFVRYETTHAGSRVPPPQNLPLRRFEGATATSTSDAMPVPSGSNAQRGQAVAVQLQTSRPVAEYRAASSAASFATTAQPVKSLAASGPANYKFAIAQVGRDVELADRLF